MGLWTRGVTDTNQRGMQAAAAVAVTLESYAADLLCPSDAAKRHVGQTDLYTDNTDWESREKLTPVSQHFFQHLIKMLKCRGGTVTKPFCVIMFR